MPNTDRIPTSPSGIQRQPLCLYLPVDLVKALKRVAREEDRSVSSFVTRALGDLRDPQPISEPQAAEPSQAA